MVQFINNFKNKKQYTKIESKIEQKSFIDFIKNLNSKKGEYDKSHIRKKMKRKFKNLIMLLIIAAVCTGSYFTMKKTSTTSSNNTMGNMPQMSQGMPNMNSSDSSSSITLTGDCYVTSLEDTDTSYSNINFNGYKLYVNNVAIN